MKWVTWTPSKLKSFVLQRTLIKNLKRYLTSAKLNIVLAYDPITSLLDIYLNGLKTYVHIKKPT